MKTLLIGINAKFIHSNLAIRSISEYAKDHYDLTIQICEFTINQYCSFILSEIVKQKPDILGFSCYIWNFEMVKRLISELKKVLPDVPIILGGPEVSYNAQDVLQQTKADYIVTGEGEQTFPELIQALHGLREMTSLHGVTYCQNNTIVTAPASPLLDMASLPFVYENMEGLENRIIYYESSRGCPFQCQYCLSCNDNHVRFRPLSQVFQHLDFFLSHKVRQVKFVDRTFNCNKNYAMQIWHYLAEHDNGCTNFHFEIAAELLDNEMLAFLPSVRKGFFQFEIGVQSTNPITLQQIKRITKLELLQTVIAALKSGQNIHLHLDLIIGLPSEGYDSFSRSFNDVFALAPDQLQVGFLKLLKGSGLYDSQQEYGIVCSDYAPYEVLYTDALSYQELLRLKMVEEMVEVYYNSNRFKQSLSYLLQFFPSPFALFEALAGYYESTGAHLRSHSNTDYYTILFDFFQSLHQGKEEAFQWYVKFDLYSHEKARKLPNWLTVGMTDRFRHQIFTFYEDRDNITVLLPEYQQYETKQIYRQAHIELFPFHPCTGKEGLTVLLFNYQQCDLLGNAAYTEIDLKETQSPSQKDES